MAFRAANGKEPIGINNIKLIYDHAEHLIGRENVDKIIEKASRDGTTELVAFLLDYKNHHLKINPTKLETLKLKHVRTINPNSTRTIEKNWIIYMGNGDASGLSLSGYKGEETDVLTFPTHKRKRPIKAVRILFPMR